MDHVAIMKPSWGFIPMMLASKKTVESRWLSVRSAPWGCVKAGDTIYFKDSGGLVSARAAVARVLEFPGLTPLRVRRLLARYARSIGISPAALPAYAAMFKNKRYAVLVFLKDVRPMRPFAVDKAGFGAMAAWMPVGDIRAVRRRS